MKTFVFIFVVLLAAPSYGQLKSSTSLRSAQKICKSWALASKKKGVSKLVIGFEGLWSYSRRMVKRLKTHQEKLRAGKRSKLRTSGFGGLVAKGVMAPLVNKHYDDFEFLMLSHSTERANRTSLAEVCASEWSQVFGDDLDLSVMGHSFGGYATMYLLHKLNKRNIWVNHVVTYDPRAYSSGYKYFYNPGNVGSFKSYYQRGGLRGYEIKGAENTRLYGVSHGKVPSAKPSVQAAMDMF